MFLYSLNGFFEYSVSSLEDKRVAHKKSVELSCFNLGLKDLLDYLTHHIYTNKAHAST